MLMQHMPAAHWSVQSSDPLIQGAERADSFNFNPHKWMLVNFYCSATWFANSTFVETALGIEREYLPRVKNSTSFVRDYCNWQISLGRRFRSLKLWFVMRMYGATGIRSYIRQHVDQTKWLEERLRADGHFEIMAPVVFALVVFRVSHQAIENSCRDKVAMQQMVNHANLSLIKEIQSDNRVFLVGTTIKGNEVLRASPGATFAKQKNVELLFSVIEEMTTL
ncbi:hypothetical protein LPJ64_006109, partial [Coemansia asiatica]